MSPFRPLRPRPSAEGSPANIRQNPDSNSDPNAESGTRTGLGPGPGPGRPNISLRRPARPRKTNSACDPCRRRKTKCDGRLPRCVMCDHRAENCEYTYTVRHRVTLAEVEQSKRGGPAEILESLRTLPPEQALELFRKLRNETPDRALNLARPSDQQHLRGLLPPTQNSLGFELTIRHPIAYPALFPVPYTDLTLGALLQPVTKSWLQGQQDESSRQVSPFASPYLTPERDEEPKSGSPDSTGAATPRPLFDERLRLLDITKWTNIPIPNDLAISIISHYLDIDYATIPLFDADLFVRDLVNLQQFFCSPFLVTAVLSWACQSYTTLHADAASFSVALFAESQQYFSDQQQPHSVTTIAALQILTMCAVTYGKDDMSLRFLQESVKLGKAMGLFNVQSEAESATVWLGGHAEWTRAASYTAWGIYNWVSVYSLHYRVHEIHTPPLLPMPRDLIASLPSDNPETSKIAFHAQLLSAASDMWVIFKDILERFYDPQYHGTTLESTLRFAEGTYHRLLSWSGALSLGMARGEESKHSVMLLHVYFHAVVTDLFRPFLATEYKSQRLYSFSTHYATPEAVYASSITQLKQLLLLYRLRYKNANYSVLWQTAVVYVANAMISEGGMALRADGQPGNEWKFYLDVCLAGLEDLYASFPVFGSIAQGMVGMALRHSAIRTNKAISVLAQLDEIERRHASIKGMTDKTEARWIIDLDLATTDFEGAQARNLVEELQKLMVEQTESGHVGEDGQP
ncbi:hypothetical protein BDP55DRAFT_550892 [Colletotrichum godetiae]|uniref:Zn(2)-C6 fungal-type domain-containing protein n=1 Tax=Colletotrichum godetiae TaxID=1209918 RepID=A0AAJ0ALN2_9PEZI|nr:uncharacterized protein BDP55DRAFT_550892 [Colletotrichum godetiae]KAK1676185.1 hypothetical protein BDP55DRAFT_550892 [Colletotrichum godetiae]